MNLSEISIRRPVFAWMLMAALIVFGAICFQRMGVSQLPDVDFPVVSINVSYDGAAPEIMETDVVDVLEDAVTSVQGVRSITSSSRYESASITVEFELGRDIDIALQEIQTKVAQAQRQLPDDMDPPTISKSNPEDQPIMWIAASSDAYELKDLMRYVRDELRDKFTTVSGVGEVFLGGYVEPNLRVWVSNEALNRFDLTITDVINTIQNEHSELPAGQIEQNAREYDVRTMGEAKTANEFSQLIINERGGQPNYRPIRLSEVAKVEEGLADIRRISRFMGQPSVGLGIKKQRGANAVSIAYAVKKRIEEVRPQLPKGFHLDLNFDTTEFIEESVAEMVFSLLLSALLTAIVCWVFLGSWSSTLNILLAIPTSIIGAFIFLYFFGFTLNTFTLLGLSLAIGIVVDDAIMVLENIVRHREMGKSRFDSALEGSKEIGFAAMAATVSVAAIFLPVAFMRGVIGKFFFQFGVTMTATVFLSLLEALTLTPMRCSQFVETHERTSKFGKWVDEQFIKTEKFYERVLRIVLQHRWKTIALSVVFFLATFYPAKLIKKEFVPAQDQSTFLVRMKTPVGSTIGVTNAKCLEAEKFFASRPEVQRYYVAVGGFGGGDVITAMMFITMKPLKERGIDAEKKRQLSQQEFMEVVRKELNKIPDVKVFLQDLSMRGFSASRGYPIEFSIRGPEWSQLAELSATMTKKLSETGLVADVDTDYLLGKPEIQIVPNRLKSAQHGVNVRNISRAIQATIGGIVTGKYESAGHRNDIRVRLLENERDSAQQIGKVFVRNNRGERIPLSEVVDIQERKSLQLITRYDRSRAITVFANIKEGASQSDAMAAVKKISDEIIPDGYYVVMSGSSETFKESFSDLTYALILGIIVAYMVLASQFNSFIHPVTVLLALPFSISGAFLALWLMNKSLNIYSFIGLILLMGIVKKNSILLVDFANQVREQGQKDVSLALLKACPIRLRPILMTSFSTIFAAIPPALALGPGAETRIPMAITVIGGMLVSTVLTLVVVPCVYSLFSRLERQAVSKS